MSTTFNVVCPHCQREHPLSPEHIDALTVLYDLEVPFYRIGDRVVAYDDAQGTVLSTKVLRVKAKNGVFHSRRYYRVLLDGERRVKNITIRIINGLVTEL